MFTEPTEHHSWLHKLVGKWSYESSCDTGPGADPITASGTEIVERFGDLWVVGDGEGEMPGGGHMRMRLTLGYDTDKGVYTGSWIGTPMSFMFFYEGTREGDVLSLDTNGPSMDENPRIVPYRDVIEFLGDDRRTLRSHNRGADGSWNEFMRAEYRRID